VKDHKEEVHFLIDETQNNVGASSAFTPLPKNSMGHSHNNNWIRRPKISKNVWGLHKETRLAWIVCF
jgi:hypothetical protein